MNGGASFDAEAEAECSEFVEVDPSGRYGRYNEILGKGASKTVYRAFDEYEGIEVAWNQVKLYDFLQNPEDLERLYCEIHLLKTLKHKNIMKFYTSWVDTSNRHINFVTEMFTSGTLRQYRLKHRRVNIRAVKHWCRQVLEGLLYLHSHDPPVIHRDLKCDNIFINGNQGEVKIGDLGLAAILRKSNAAHCVGTPEFMAPEVYEEDYNELVDIYSFGMCLLEMITFEYPYSECNHPAQIYKKVSSGKMPESLYKVNDPEVRQFVEKCLATVSLRLSAKELLEDPFLQLDDYGYDLKSLQYQRDCYEVAPIIRQSLNGIHSSNTTLMSGSTDNLGGYGPVSELDFETSEIDLFDCEEDDKLAEFDASIKGRRREDDGIFLRIRIADKEGRVRNIYFPFDTETDTALSVATEMIAELDITDQDNGCAAVHGRFEEITYQVEGSESSATEGAQDPSRQPSGIHYADIWAQRDEPDLCSEELKDIHCEDKSNEASNQSTIKDDGRTINVDDQRHLNARKPPSFPLSDCVLMDYENEIRQELRWLKAKYQMQLRELRDQQLGSKLKLASTSPDTEKLELSATSHLKLQDKKPLLRSLVCGNNFLVDAEKCTSLADQMVQNGEETSESNSPEQIVTAKDFFAGALLPQSLYRATSLPVDAVDV
ncbi:hypothetical protein PIB30_011490 [Stylosanthes scabra]|uniref:non-specific serine/threonine protein kinase n=1 Tax=Stylosanthes scabra TaxID=79078 RepID=A0ABU6S642_9FABA|nr:hypothetical protein [Stylosanthes scabra]